MRQRLSILAITGLTGLSVCAGLASGAPQPKRPAPAPHVPPLVGGLLTPQIAQQLEERFTREIWPLLERANGGCVTCHNAQNPSQLHFSPDGSGANFKKLLGQGFFEPENASGLLARILSPEPGNRMPPPPLQPWNEEEIALLRRFVADLYDKAHPSATRSDEQFPAELLDPYTGQPVKSGPDNTFLTYRQLKGKIATVFGDNWVRDERDLFRENLAQFGGADFQQRFDESSKASATYLSALDTLSRDVASRAFLSSSGPFAGRPASLPSPVSMSKPDARYRTEITRLYRKVLFRAPTETEVQQAFAFLKNVYAAAGKVAEEETQLDFELTAEDAEGRTASRSVRVRISNDPLGVYQEHLDQTLASPEPLARKKLDGVFTLKPNSPGQAFFLTNETTHGNVSLAGIELKGPLPEQSTQRISVTDPGVSVQGAWQQTGGKDQASFEDGGNNKGNSQIRVPLRVVKAGKYEITVLWRSQNAAARGGRGRRNQGVRNATAVPIEVYSHDASVIANPPQPEMPPKGEARFYIDQTVDTIPHWDLKAAFRFGDSPTQGVVISNAGTEKQVVADAVTFVPQPAEKTGAQRFTLDDPQAEGGWHQYQFPNFRPYNLVGRTALTDNNAKKGEMELIYRPAKAKEWKADTAYRPLVTFPGKATNETRVPVLVRAEESTPIVHIAAPLHADVGAAVTLDASATYNVQRSPLKFTWVQNGGPRVRLSDPHTPRITFKVEPLQAQQAAWEGLCRALIKHPDFLFTRPRSLDLVKDPADRRRLQLVKLAQDLVARPPTEAEIRQLESGASLAKLVDHYLDSQEFRDFYFHRVRLVLESRGTEIDDEPARLWSYVVFNDLPFKEILTADYTVDTQFRKQSRPEYHGKTGLLTMKGFIQGKPGLPHFNYAALVTEKFLGYVYEVPPAVVMMRDSITAASTTSPTSTCYSCHKILTPLAYQRLAWDDEGNYKPMDGKQPVDDTDRSLIPSYPFRGKGMEAFAIQAVEKERFVRTYLQTHFVWYFGREMRHQTDERGLYKRLWDKASSSNYNTRHLLKALLTSPEYLNGRAATVKRAVAKPAVKATVSKVKSNRATAKKRTPATRSPRRR